MSDNSNKSGLGAGQIRVIHYRTETQVRPFEGFAPDEVIPREPFGLTSEGGRTLQLAKPYEWTVGADCLGNFDGTDTTNRAEAKALCANCKVRPECLESAMAEEVDKDGLPLSHHSRFLVRGGLTPRGRVDLAAERAAEAEVTAV